MSYKIFLYSLQFVSSVFKLKVTVNGLLFSKQVTSSNDLYAVENEISFASEVNTIDVFTRWNLINQTAEGLVMVAIKQEIIFYRVSNDLKSLNEFWRINLNKEILHLKYFSLNNVDSVVFITRTGSNESLVTADIYSFDYEKRGFWLIQYIVLKYVCSDIAILDTGREILLSFPQNNVVENYIYQNHDSVRSLFVQMESIESKSVRTVSSFSMGGYNYLAVGGFDAHILRYHRGKLQPQTMLSNSFGFVEQWFPIPARSHRDDLLLLVQHRVVYQTHSYSVLETLIWDGQAFDTIAYTPCRRGLYRNNFGITCMLDPERDSGIFGATIVQQGKLNVHILLR